MKHYLRFILVLLLSTVWCVGGYAQETPEVTLDFSKAEWGLPSNNEKAEKSYTCDGYTVKFGSSTNGHKALEDGVIMGQSGATLTLPSFDFDVEKIILRKNTGKVSGKVTFNIFVGDKAVSTQVKGCDKDVTFQIAKDYQTAGNIYTIKVTNKNNLQFSKIEIYKKASTGTPTTIAFNTDFDATKTYTFTEGVAPSDYTQPTVTLSTSEATGKGAIEYTSSNTNVVDVDKTTGALSFVGKTLYDTEATISAQFVATAGSGYANSNKLTYKVKNVEKQKTATTLKFAEPSGSINIGEAFTLPTLTLTAGEETLTGKTYSYKSSNQEVATVDESGNVTIKSSGTTDITATYEGDDVYAMSYDTYKLTVVDPNKKEIIFVAGTDRTTSTSVEKGNIRVSTSSGNLNTQPEYRFYGSSPVKVVSSDGKICKIQFEYTQQSKFKSCTTGVLNETKDIWTGSATEITFTHSEQVRVSKIIVTLEPTVKKPTLSFSEESVTVMQGKENEFTAPTLTLLDAEGNPVTLAENDIYYESLNKDVAKIEDPAICKIDFITPGTADIKATYFGSNTAYENLSATFTLIYKEKVKTATTVEFTSTANSVNINDNIFVKAVVKANDVEVEGVKVIYSASNDNVIVDETTGEIVGNKEGTSTITASFAGNVDYAASSNTFDVIVTDPNKLEVTFDFVNNKYGYGIAQVPVGAKFTSEDVTITHVKNGTQNKTAFYGDSFRVYKGSQLNISVAAGYYMTKIVFDNIKDNTFSCTPGTLNGNVWEGTASSIDLDVNGTNQFKTITVSYAKYPEVVVDENATQDDMLNLIIKNSNKVVNAKLNRTLIADGGWYTFSVPFDVKDVNSTALSGAEIRKYKSMNGSIMEFEATTELKAEHAYLVKPSVDITTPIFNSVTLSEGDNLKDGVNGYEFIATLGSTELKTDGTNLFLGADNKFYIPTETGKIMKALRGYFVAPSGESGSKMGINIDGETNYISTLNGSAVVYGKVYNLNGQYVGNDVKSLKKGVYVVNGRKFIVK